MSEKLVKGAFVSGGVLLVCSLIVSLVVSLLVYFEWMGTVAFGRALFVGFVVSLFVATFIFSRFIKKGGLLIGVGVAIVFGLLGAMYRTIGVGNGIGLAFWVRSLIVLLVTVLAGVTGVNTASED